MGEEDELTYWLSVAEFIIARKSMTDVKSRVSGCVCLCNMITLFAHTRVVGECVCVIVVNVQSVL